jgi:hypothetical protein
MNKRHLSIKKTIKLTGIGATELRQDVCVLPEDLLLRGPLHPGQEVLDEVCGGHGGHIPSEHHQQHQLHFLHANKHTRLTYQFAIIKKETSKQ